MSLWQRITGAFSQRREPPMRVMLIADRGDWFQGFNGTLYRSDVVRAAIRPVVKAVGKLAAMHIRETAQGLQINPEPYIRMLLDEPNPYSSGQMFRERLTSLLKINNNAFAAILRDENGLPEQLYAIPAVVAEAIRDDAGRLFIRFQLANGQTITLPYSDVIHLRDDYHDNDVFGVPKAQVLQQLLDVLAATDESIVQAVKRSSVIRWILRFRAQLKPEDRKRRVDEFVRDYLTVENEGGAIPSDTTYDLDQVKGEQFVPTAPHQRQAIQRLWAFFGVNEKIVTNTYSEDEWVAFFEAEVEPIARQMSEEFSRKLFTRRERGFGNRIIFDASHLAYASMRTKLELVRLVDRGAMTPNEWRRVLNLPPIEGGDKPIRRLDTEPVDGAEAMARIAGLQGNGMVALARKE